MSTEKMDVDVPEHNALPVESNGATPPDASGTQHAKDEDKAQPPVEPRRPSRLKDVSPRTLEDFKNSRELVWTMLGAIEGTPLPIVHPAPTCSYMVRAPPGAPLLSSPSST